MKKLLASLLLCVASYGVIGPFPGGSSSGGGGGSGTVTSAGASTTNIGPISVSGSPITTSGTFNFALTSNPWQIANGGTGATTAAGAVTSLLAGGLASSYILGTTTNNAAAAGYIGEYYYTKFGPTSFSGAGSNNTLGSFSLTAGDWDVTLVYAFDGTPTVAGSLNVNIGISTTNSSVFSGVPIPGGGTNADEGNTWVQMAVLSTAGGDQTYALPNIAIAVATTTTLYINAINNVSTNGGLNVYGRVSARRVR